MGLSDEELQEVYTWVDEIPLSRPKRSIARDFSDGVLMAEVVKHYYPRLVEMHNYSTAHSVSQKLYNWDTLNQKVFQKLGFGVSKSDIQAVANCQPQAVERVLVRLRDKLAKYKNKPGSGDRASITPRSYEDIEKEPSRRLEFPKRDDGFKSGSMADPEYFRTTDEEFAQKSPKPSFFAEETGKTARNMIWEKDQTIQELRETIEILDQKVQKLEQLVRLKDKKIVALQSQLTSPSTQTGNAPLRY